MTTNEAIQTKTIDKMNACFTMAKACGPTAFYNLKNSPKAQIREAKKAASEREWIMYGIAELGISLLRELGDENGIKEILKEQGKLHRNFEDLVDSYKLGN